MLLFIPMFMRVVRERGADQSFATWFLWAVLDGILVGSLIEQHGNFWVVLGFAVGDLDRAHSGLRKRAAWINLVGAGEEARGGLGVAELERGAACADQRIEVLGVVGKRANVAGERCSRGLVVRGIATLRSGRHGHYGRNPASAGKQRSDQPKV